MRKHLEELEQAKAKEARRREAARKAAMRAAARAEDEPMPTNYPDSPNWLGIPKHVKEFNEQIRRENEEKDEAHWRSRLAATAWPQLWGVEEHEEEQEEEVDSELPAVMLLERFRKL